MNPSIFTRIIKGEIPCHKIYENEHVFAFLDIYPVQPGHTLVIPKKQVEFIWDLDDETYQHLMQATKKIALRIREIMDAPYVGERVIGLDVPHSHVHLIPFATLAEFNHPQDMQTDPDHDVLSKIATKLAF